MLERECECGEHGCGWDGMTGGRTGWRALPLLACLWNHQKLDLLLQMLLLNLSDGVGWGGTWATTTCYLLLLLVLLQFCQAGLEKDGFSGVLLS